MLYVEYLPHPQDQCWKYRVGRVDDEFTNDEIRAVDVALKTFWGVRQSWRIADTSSDAPEFAVVYPIFPWVESAFEAPLAKRIADALGYDEFQLLVHRGDGDTFNPQFFKRSDESAKYRRMKTARTQSTAKVA